MSLEGKKVLIGITGGIAAYKICELIRMFKRDGAEVKTVVTPNALEFVTKTTLQNLSGNKVYIENFNTDDYYPEHISLCNWADCFIIAPATANTIAKLANGICDNLLTTLGNAFTKPVIIAPAMNCDMYNNPITQLNISKLKNYGYTIINPEVGFLACGAEGVGRLTDLSLIYSAAFKILNNKCLLEGKKILVTAGGTVEKIDPVRYISNFSSGKMGLALARIAANMGADVTLVSTFPAEGHFKNFVTPSASEMMDIVLKNYRAQDVVIMAAAVADWKIKNYSENKVKKNQCETWNLEFVKNPDILKTICEDREGSSPVIVGFCAESEKLLENAELKIKTKGCDFIIANDISKKDSGFSSDYNEVYIINQKLETKFIERAQKQEIAQKILENIFEQIQTDIKTGSICTA